MAMYLPGALLWSNGFKHSSLRKVNLFKGLVAYVYWIDTVFVQNNLST